MSRTLIVRDYARDDLKVAIAQYQEHMLGLGHSLWLQVEATIDRLEQYPEIYQVDFGMVRRGLTRRFPFAVYYRVLPEIVEVIAILDCRADPSNVRTRDGVVPHH